MTDILLTSRLALRPLRAEDLDFVSAMLGDARVMRYYPAPLTRAGSAEWIDRQLARYTIDGHGLWMAELRDSRETVGQVGVMRQRVEGESGRLPEVGYLLHHPYWGRGLATEGAAGAVEWAFTHLATDRVVSLIRPENAASRRVALRNGFTLRHTVPHAGLTHELWEVRREVWREVWRARSPGDAAVAPVDDVPR